MGNEMKKEIKAKGSKPRIADVTGELDLGLLAFAEVLWASQAVLKTRCCRVNRPVVITG